MAKTHETIADIIAEMWLQADEMEKTLAQIDQSRVPLSIVQEMRMYIDSRRLDADRLEAAWNREHGNCAKLREALEELVANIEMRSSTFGLNVMVDTKTYLDAKTALFAPPRNCDVGTAEEQVGRFLRVCRDKKHLDNVRACPLFAGTNCYPLSCLARWAQMPYEEGKTK